MKPKKHYVSLGVMVGMDYQLDDCQWGEELPRKQGPAGTLQEAETHL